MSIDLIEIWNLYSDLLWESGQYKSMAEAFVFEIHGIMLSSGLKKFDNYLIDEIISTLRRKGNRNSTINRKLAVLYKLLRKAQSMGILKKVPSYLRLRENNSRVRFLTTEEENAIFLKIREKDLDQFRLCQFLVDSGARVGEALNLKWSDVTFSTATFWITKSGRSRTVPLTARAKEAVYSCSSKKNTGPFSMIDYQKFRYNWNASKKAVGLGDDSQVVPHILRHTCASRLVQAGIDLRRVQVFLGHQSIQMTLRYAHLATSDLDQCVYALESVVKGNDERDKRRDFVIDGQALPWRKGA